MEIALEKKLPHYKCNIQEIITLWSNKIYYPVLYVERDYKNTSNVLILVENLGIGEDNKWQIPVTITTQTKHNFTLSFRDHGKWLKTTDHPPTCEFSLPYKEDDWIIVNLQQTGYYRVKYDETNWKRITQFLNSEKYTDIHVLNRAQIIDDAFHLMLDHELYAFKLWNLIDYLRQDVDYIAWYPMFKALEFMSIMFPLPLTKVQIRKETIGLLLTDLLKNIGYDENPNENDLTKSLRQEAAKWACVLNASACIHVAANKLTQHFTDPETHKLLPWWKYWTYCNGVTEEKKWALLMRKYQEHYDHNILEAMACCGNFHTIQIYLELLTSDIIKNAKDCVYSFFYIVAKHARHHKVFNHLLDQFENIKPKEISMNVALIYFINHLYIREQLYKIRAVMKNRINRSAYRNIEIKIRIRLDEITKINFMKF